MAEPNPRAKLYAKIAAVTKAVGRIPKNGRNNFHKSAIMMVPSTTGLHVW